MFGPFKGAIAIAKRFLGIALGPVTFPSIFISYFTYSDAKYLSLLVLRS